MILDFIKTLKILSVNNHQRTLSLLLFSVLGNDEDRQQNVSSSNKSTAEHYPGREASPKQSGADHNSSSNKEVEQLLNGMTPSTNALPLNKSYSYELFLSALVPDQIKENIWDKRYVEMAQLYQIQISCEVTQNFSVDISNQGPSTLVKVQPKQTQGQELSINQRLTALNYYMDRMNKSFQMKHQAF